MQRRVFLSTAGALIVAGCGGFRQSRMNPGNWFGRSTARERTTPPTPAEAGNPLIPESKDSIFRRGPRKEVYEGTLVDRITALSVDRASDGAIIRVTGQTRRQGAFDVRLIPARPENDPAGGGLLYELRALQPSDTPIGAARTRKVHAAVFVSNQTLDRASEIRVRGERNARVSRR